MVSVFGFLSSIIFYKNTLKVLSSAKVLILIVLIEIYFKFADIIKLLMIKVIIKSS